ncbi:MAG TPA: proton-conducting transporter membrane subunit, partial [Lacipirellulaceae bacterium]|nr:proton-conducting transporter membrane subunit [Lacipirellulaceae bacterium]
MPAFHLHLSAILLPALIMLAGWLAPASMLNRRPRAVAKTAVWLTGLLLAASAAALTVQSLGLIGSTTDWRLLGEGPMASLVYYDGVSGLGVLLVSFVGFVVCQYSRRYLAGDPRQGDYFRWTGATVGAVTIAMLAGNLLLLFAAWLATSLSLHRLLLHYPERRAAQEAAWTKFAVSRLGDCLLLAAAGLVYREFGTLNLGELFQAFSGGAISTERAGTASTIGMLLACAAVAKSAQFPFHIWLPNTLETPTPVSALMHAGIVNAGGYMMIRLSPIIVQAPL